MNQVPSAIGSGALSGERALYVDKLLKVSTYSSKYKFLLLIHPPEEICEIPQDMDVASGAFAKLVGPKCQ